MRRIKLFTHTDLDGVGCALVAKVYASHGRDIDLNISYCENSSVDSAIQKYLKTLHCCFDECYITDLSVSKETAELIDASPSFIRLFDHHASAEWLNEYSWATVEVTRDHSSEPTCGTMLFYKSLFPYTENSRLEQFVEDVTAWDTWTWKERGWKRPQLYSTILNLKGRENFIEELLPKLCPSVELPKGWQQMMLDEEVAEALYIDEKSSQAFEYEYEGNKYLAVYASKYVSKLGNTLSERNPEYAGVIMIAEGAISLRTARPDINLSEIAKNHGGGGHPQAAGITITEEQSRKILDIIFKEK